MKALKLSLSIIAITAVYYFFGVASAPSNKATYYSLVPIKDGIIATDGVTITAEDGSFELKSGERFNTPFTCSGWYGTIATNTVSRSKGKKVRVTYPGYSKPFYGILEFANAYSNCAGATAATRSYYIQIPESYIQAAMGGKVSVVYEYYPCKSNSLGTTYNYSTWVLFLSDSPISNATSETPGIERTGIIKKKH